jgi:hypothetical protein
MSAADTLSVMNELLRILYRSLPVYLHDAQPWHDGKNERAANVVAGIAQAQQELAQRVADFILVGGGQPEPGVYPVEFSTANWHFVALQFLLRPLAAHQAQDVRRIEACVARLAHDREARALAEEALGLAKGHLEVLQELAVSN